MKQIDQILEKAYAGKRLSLSEGELLLEQADLFQLGTVANHLYQKRHPDNLVTFIIDRNITFTNICIKQCKFCAFYRDINSREAFVLSMEEIFKKVEELVSLGGTQIMLQGGIHPELGLDYYCHLLSEIKDRFKVDLHSCSPSEVAYLAQKSRLSLVEVLTRLKECGLDSLPGGGAEILVDRVRKIVSPHKIDSQTWLAVMEAAHNVGLRTTATMVYGLGETLEERIIHLVKIRELQDKTGVFRAFIPWSFQPGHTRLKDYPPASGIDYLKMVAISRIMLDNVDNIQAGWVTEGTKLAQIALTFGANDLGGILIEEVVVRATGVEHKMSVEEAIRLIQEMGKKSAQRNTKYEIIRIF